MGSYLRVFFYNVNLFSPLFSFDLLLFLINFRVFQEGLQLACRSFPFFFLRTYFFANPDFFFIFVLVQLSPNLYTGLE